VEPPNVTVEINHCILGAMRVAEGSDVRIADSILDATSDAGVAYAQTDGASAGGPLRLVNATVIGKVHTVLFSLVSNAILLARLDAADAWTAPVRAERRQEGCVRFSYVPTDAVVPRRFRCQPERASEAVRCRPQFTSLRYGESGYGQLALRSAREIRTGADDEAEMGAFHGLFQPQRETNLRVRLAEYLRFGLEAGIFYAT
jgi:hypothetical protein